ncbi:MAG: ATP-binding protein [Candidatus Diapherotrites archaeon]
MDEDIVLTLKNDWDYPPHYEKQQGHFIGRKEELENLVDNLSRKNSGSILIAGDRGVGKTALVYKALQEVKKSKDRSIFIILNASQLEMACEADGTSDLKEKIIKNLIRRLYAIMRDEKDLKDVFPFIEMLYRKVRFKEETVTMVRNIRREESETESVEYEKQLKLPVEYTVSIGSSLAALFLILNPLTPNVAINAILPIATASVGPFAFLYARKYQKTKSAKKSQAANAEQYYELDDNIGNLEFDLEQVLERVHSKGYKVVFVIDELDKIDNQNVTIGAIKSFKNLFNLSSAIFVLIAGRDTFDRIQAGKGPRTPDYTLFTHKIFLKRPTFWDIESFVDEIIAKPDMAKLKQNDKYKEFRNFLSFEAKTDFFELYAILRDYIKFDRSGSTLAIPRLTTKELTKARLQKAMGQVFGRSGWGVPSKWHMDEEILTSLYLLIDGLAEKDKGDEFEDDFGNHPTDGENAPIKRDLCKYLERLGAIEKISVREEVVGNKPKKITKYRWMGFCSKVPSEIREIMMEHEMTFIDRASSLKKMVVEIGNLYKVANSERTYSMNGFQSNSREILTLVQKLTNRNLVPIFDQITPIEQDLNTKFPKLHKREEVEQHIKNLEGEINALKEYSRIALENIIKEKVADMESSQLQTNVGLFSAIQGLRNNVVHGGILHSVIFKKDLSKQLLMSVNMSSDLINQNKQLIRQNSKTLKIVNIQTDPSFDYKDMKHLGGGFSSVKVTDNFEELGRVIKKLMHWFLS